MRSHQKTVTRTIDDHGFEKMTVCIEREFAASEITNDAEANKAILEIINSVPITPQWRRDRITESHQESDMGHYIRVMIEDTKKLEYVKRPTFGV